MSLKRRSYEAGHRPKFLVIIDDSAECDRAVYYASRRAARIGASVVMLLVIEPHDRHQQWLGVADIMKAEAYEAADQKLDAFSARANGVAGITPFVTHAIDLSSREPIYYNGFEIGRRRPTGFSARKQRPKESGSGAKQCSFRPKPRPIPPR